MRVAVLFHNTPVAGQSEVTDVVEDAQCFILIFKNKPPLLQYVYLFSEGDGLFCIFQLKETSHPGPLVLRREAWWDLLLQRYCFYSKRPNILMGNSIIRVKKHSFCALPLTFLYILSETVIIIIGYTR